jgi:hypothetical protein
MKQPHENIKEWLSSMHIKYYTIRPDVIVNVNGTADLGGFKGHTLPNWIGNVWGNFFLSFTNITSLQGVPQSIGGDFSCNITYITSLHNIHKLIKRIGGAFYCNSGSTHIYWGYC